MEQFKAKFIYPFFFVYLLFFLFFSLSLLFLESKIIYYFITGKSSADDLKLFFGFLFLFGYFSLMCGHMTLLLRNGLIIQKNRIVLINHLSFQKTDITDLIKGYSRTDFGKYSTSKNTILLYLSDGRIINLPKFMYLNFGDIEPILIDNKVKFLGEEPFEWKNIIQRKYQY